MKAHHLSLAKYWSKTAANFQAAGYMHMATLFKQYSAEHLAKAEEYEG